MTYVLSSSHSFVFSMTSYVTSVFFFFVECLLMFINYQQNALINYYFEFLFLYSRIISTNKSNFNSSAIMKPKRHFYQVMLVEIA